MIIIKKLIQRLLSSRVRAILRSLKRGNYLFFLYLLPVNPRKIVISSYYGKPYGDNGKYIIEEINKTENNYDIVWLLKKEYEDEANFPDNVRIVGYGSYRALLELATAKIWIDNCRKMICPPKRIKQFYIQTWHGSIPLKKVEKDVEEKLSPGYVDSAKHDSKIADVFLSNSKFCTEIYRKSFWYNGRVLEIGSPRCDVFFRENNDVDIKVRDLYNIKSDAKIVIYAPTFRADGNLEVYNIDFKKLIEVLENKFGGEWIVLIRLHPNISNKADLITYSERLINATNYNDMYELLSISDMLITDYSSTMFEFSLNYKPVFLYCSDIAEYRKDRDLYFDLEKLPYKIAEDNTQLIQSIKDFDEEEYRNKVHLFYKELGIQESGNASVEVVKLINKIVNQ